MAEAQPGNEPIFLRVTAPIPDMGLMPGDLMVLEADQVWFSRTMPVSAARYLIENHRDRLRGDDAAAEQRACAAIGARWSR